MRLVVYNIPDASIMTDVAEALNFTGAAGALVQVQFLPHRGRAQALLRFEDYRSYCYFCEKTQQKPMSITEYLHGKE